MPHSLARVLVVDDSAFMRQAISRMIAAEPAFEVVGTAVNGSEALEKIAALDPDVVTLDVDMPRLDGLATLRCIMSRFPRPVIMVSATTEKGAQTTFSALSAGAFDYIPKSLSATSLEIEHIRADLITKIHAAAQSRRARRDGNPGKKPVQSAAREHRQTPAAVPAIVAIGTSTGGPKALQEILPLFPRELPLPVLVVQHMPEGFSASFAQRLSRMCAIGVCEAKHGEALRSGVAYIAPAGLHMRVVSGPPGSQPIISLEAEPRDAVHVPSIDILMKSVADLYKSRAMGIIMTGMGSDGLDGMTAIYNAGGLTLGQDEATCTVYGMPRVCAEAGIVRRILPLLEIPAQVMQATRRRRHA